MSYFIGLDLSRDLQNIDKKLYFFTFLKGFTFIFFRTKGEKYCLFKLASSQIGIFRVVHTYVFMRCIAWLNGKTTTLSILIG
jgi:hypothetical protein